MKKLVLILTMAFVGVAAWSQSSSVDEGTRKQLAGVTGFQVLVQVVPDSLASLLPVSSIQTVRAHIESAAERELGSRQFPTLRVNRVT
jgi:hypothetical protein